MAVSNMALNHVLPVRGMEGMCTRQYPTLLTLLSASSDPYSYLAQDTHIQARVQNQATCGHGAETKSVASQENLGVVYNARRHNCA